MIRIRSSTVPEHVVLGRCFALGWVRVSHHAWTNMGNCRSLLFERAWRFTTIIYCRRSRVDGCIRLDLRRFETRTHNKALIGPVIEQMKEKVMTKKMKCLFL